MAIIFFIISSRQRIIMILRDKIFFNKKVQGDFTAQDLIKFKARTVYNLDAIGITNEDLEQELTIKVLKAIESWLKKKKLYQKSGKGYDKPMPYPYYIKAVMNNRVRDYIKKVQETSHHMSIQENQIDIGRQESGSYSPASYVIGDVDCLANLSGIGKKVFTMYINGYKRKELEQKFGHAINVKSLIDNQVAWLKESIGSLESSAYKYTFSLDD